MKRGQGSLTFLQVCLTVTRIHKVISQFHQGTETIDLSLSEATTALISADRGRRILGVSGVKPKVLVVDDDPANRQVLSDMLTPLGCILREAGDGQAALTHAMLQFCKRYGRWPRASQ